MKHKIINERNVEEYAKVADVEISLTEEDIAQLDKQNMTFSFDINMRIGKVSVKKETK
ncbi:hypothetical protein LCGC14_1871980 [marine sediment metagenome]|uniref:Uncharacterized protein n=1 Tax=marine sediment metagenome TaxID=412755 RepID=A0A0F9GSU5_9ZZZZ